MKAGITFRLLCLVAPFGVLVLVGAQAQEPGTQPPGLSFETYKDPLAGYRVDYPAGWLATPVRPAQMVVVSQDATQHTAAVVWGLRAKRPLSAEETVGACLRWFGFLAQDVTAVGAGQHLAQAPDAYEQEFTFTHAGVTCRGAITAYTYPDGQAVVWIRHAPADQYQALEPVLERILASYVPVVRRSGSA